jgi:succinate-acetate transporter protein
MVKEIRRFFDVLLIVEILVILLVMIPAVSVYFLIDWLGYWGILIAVQALVPWYAAWIDHIRRNA